MYLYFECPQFSTHNQCTIYNCCPPTHIKTHKPRPGQVISSLGSELYLSSYVYLYLIPIRISIRISICVCIPAQDIHIHFWNKNSLLVQKCNFCQWSSKHSFFWQFLCKFFLDKRWRFYTLSPEKCTFGKILERRMSSKFPNLARKLTWSRIPESHF